jgi:hypothetical protein
LPELKPILPTKLIRKPCAKIESGREKKPEW